MSKKAYVFALDGLLEDPSDRLGRPFLAMQKLILMLHAEYTIYFISSSSFCDREKTEEYLNKWHIPFDKIYFKHDKFDGTDYDYKLKMVDKIQSIGHSVEAYFDRDEKASELIGSLGVDSISINFF